MEINFKGTAAKPFKLTGVATSLTVKELKALCQPECGLAPEGQRLLFKGKVLKDEETLEALKIGDKATLFLVKGVVQGEAAKPAEPEKAAEEPEVRVPCAAGCGFFGSSRTENMCSKCFGEKLKKEENKGKEAEDKKKEEVKKKEEEEKAAADAAKPKREEQKDVTRCWTCNKKIGILGFQCKCEYYFCSKHRYAEDHECTYDHQGKGRENLAKLNPQVMGEKLQDIT